MPISFFSFAANFLATASTMSFSVIPPGPTAPGSLPPCPGSNTIFRRPELAWGGALGLFICAVILRPLDAGVAGNSLPAKRS